MNLNKAREKARAQLEKLYEDTCTVTELQTVKNETTKVSEPKEVVVLENQPCKLSFSSVQSASDGDVATVGQVVKLFISPDIVIKPGSKISVTHNGVVTEYASSGQEGNFFTHKEIVLDLFEDYA